MKKALLVTYNNFYDKNTGGMQCSSRNYDAVSSVFDTDVYLAQSRFFDKLLSLLFFYFPTITFKHNKEIIKLISKNNYSLIFFDVSLFGITLKKVARKNPNLNIVTFFHNVEYDYINVRFNKNIIKYLYKFLAWYNEKLTIKYSKFIISLNRRDSNRLKELYNRMPDMEIPITFDDKLKEEQLKQKWNTSPKTGELLYVSSYNENNLFSIKWFIDNVLEELSRDVKLIIVGKDFEVKKKELEEIGKNITVVGTVDDLSEYYLSADAIVAPIFKGAGMKVKVAEAYMYGKYIFGTNEAFEGYILTPSTFVCNTKADYVDSLNHFFSDKTRPKNSTENRSVFQENYSSETSTQKFKTLLEQF
ncbi:MAG TPA: glycosyltransferase [Bacteroidales bacterium]|nr:glycosyltransferase [Bacteroidales bacterium]